MMVGFQKQLAAMKSLLSSYSAHNVLLHDKTKKNENMKPIESKDAKLLFFWYKGREILIKISMSL